MPANKFSWGSFILGIATGVVVTLVVAGLLLYQFVEQAAVGGMQIDRTFFSGKFGENIVHLITNQGNIFVYGTLTELEENTLMLTAQTPSGTETYTFYFDDATRFVVQSYENGKATETTFAPRSLTSGEYITVYTEQAVRPNSNQYAVKVTRQ